MMKLLCLCIIYAIVNGKSWREADVVEEIRNPTGMIMHERARLYGAEDYMRIRTILDLKDWKKQEEVFNTDLKTIIDHEGVSHIEYMDALNKRAQINYNQHNVDRWIRNLKQTVQPLKAIMKPKLSFVNITETKLDEEDNTIYLSEGCSKITPYFTEASHNKLKDAISSMKTAETPSTTLQRPAIGDNATIQNTFKVAKNKELLQLVESRIKVISLVELIENKIEDMDEVMTSLYRNSLPLTCFSDEVWTQVSQMFKFPATTETKALETIKWALRKFGLTTYDIKDESRIHIEVIVPNPTTMKKMSLIDLEYYPIQQDGYYYLPSDQPTKMIVSQSLNWALPAETEEKIEENCIPSTRTPNQFWCFGLTERALTKQHCMRDIMNQEVDVEECYDPVEAPETEITDIEPYLTLVSPSETETLAITCNEDTENLEIDKPSIIELPEGCTGIINNHKIYGHPWNSEDRVIKHYNELTPEVDEDEDLMFQDEDDDHHIQIKTKTNKIIPWLYDIESFGKDLIQSIYSKLILCLIAIFAVLYCLCAPMSWPRCNCCIWVVRMLMGTLRQINKEVRKIRSSRSTTRSTQPDPLRPLERELINWDQRRRGE